MKIPLGFQVTEFDCGTVSLINALSYLYDREEIPAELVKNINIYTLDCYDDKGNLGQGGTSKEAITMLMHWITNYANNNNFGIKCQKYEGSNVTISCMKKDIENGGVLIVRCFQGCEHYVIITNIDEDYAYIFDPYYLDETYYDIDGEVTIIFDKPFAYNRIVKLNRLLSETKKDFSLGKLDNRECVAMFRK